MVKASPPQIAFLNSGDPRDRRLWSGTPYYMVRALEKQMGPVSPLGPVEPIHRLLGKLLNGSVRIFGKQYDYTHSVFMAKAYARAFGRKLCGRKFDLIFAPAASTEITFLETKTPTLYTSDATFAMMVNYYPGFSNLLKTSIRQGHFIEQSAVSKSALLVYPTPWAAQSAIRDYGAGPAKVFVAPYGANLDEIPAREKVLQRKKSGRCRLLFLGVNWERKGGPLAFETLLELEEMGLPAELTVCGCTPPARFSHKGMTVIPFLDKNDSAQSGRLTRLFLESDFLLLPTRCECYGVVFCEAAAFGLPVISTDTGGVSGVVREGENGHLLPYVATGAGYARLVSEIYGNDARYYGLVQKSRKEFEDRLNWDTWAQAVKRLIAEKLDIK